MRRLIIPILFILGAMVVWNIRPPQEDVLLVPTVVFENGVEIKIEIADDQAERVQGLSDRDALPENTGLLFLHEVSKQQSYWMKDMNFPIDILWIQDGVIVGYVKEAQPENPPTTIYTSPVPVDTVLEVSSGFIEKNSVNEGDILDIRLINQ